MSAFPTVSIIVPVYNVEKYFDECMKSLCTQTYPKLEILLIDDGSTDNSGNLCDEWARKDNRIMVVHQKNAGVGAARNTGLRKATGKAIVFADPDDRYESDTIAYLIHLSNEHPDTIICCDFYKTTPDLTQTATHFFAGIEALKAFIMHPAPCYSVWAKLFPKHLVGDETFAPYYRGEDALFMLNIIEKTHCNLLLSRAQKYFYRINENSVSTRPFSAREFDTLDAEQKIFEATQLADSVTTQFSAIHYMSVFHYIYLKLIKANHSINEFDLMLKHYHYLSHNLPKISLFGFQKKIHQSLRMYGVLYLLQHSKIESFPKRIAFWIRICKILGIK